LRKKRNLTKEEITDLAVAWAVVVSSLALALALGAGLYTILSTIASWILPISILAAIIFLIYMIGSKP